MMSTRCRELRGFYGSVADYFAFVDKCEREIARVIARLDAASVWVNAELRAGAPIERRQ